MTRVVDTDICIVGSGITAALMAAKIADEVQARITVVEAGGQSTPFTERHRARQRFLDYGESPWIKDHLDDQNALGVAYGFSPDMHVGGLAMHWGGVTPRYSPDDFKLRSMHGVGDDWPFSYDDLDPFYQEAEERMGVSGAQGPPSMDPRGKPFPMPALPLSYNLQQLQAWTARAGITMWSQPSAKNSVAYDGRAVCQRCDTCYPVCPTGAKYAPDVTFDRLVQASRVELLTNVLVRRLHADPKSGRIIRATGNATTGPAEEVEFRAKTFVLAAGYAWTSQLLLLSATDAHPTGLANRSGLVGKYLAGHRNINAYVQLPLELYPGMNGQHSLVSKQFMRVPRSSRYLRHDLRVWETSNGREARWKDDAGNILLGTALLADWKARAKTGAARVRAYYDVLPARDSELTLDASVRNRWGDPMPRIAFKDAPESAALRGYAEETIKARFTAMAKAGDGKVIGIESSALDIGQEHPAGGCRMGDNPASSVVDGWGRAHDHENLFVAGAPAHVTASCCNGTLTFVAVGLRTASAVGKAFPAIKHVKA
ncbi:MAG: GMC family oxidoreductase [Gemmatimonadetes bacterium]|nr:GMC family oxidoreductase [Gemmatimonadota bacterium]